MTSVVHLGYFADHLLQAFVPREVGKQLAEDEMWVAVGLVEVDMVELVVKHQITLTLAMVVQDING